MLFAVSNMRQLAPKDEAHAFRSQRHVSTYSQG